MIHRPFWGHSILCTDFRPGSKAICSLGALVLVQPQLDLDPLRTAQPLDAPELLELELLLSLSAHVRLLHLL